MDRLITNFKIAFDELLTDAATILYNLFSKN